MANISFIIPALNEELMIERCIISIHKFTPVDLEYEIIVGDHSSTDNTKLIAQKAGASVLTVNGGRVGHVRNCAALNAVGDVLVFLDSDIELSENWGYHIKDSIKQLENGSYKIIGSFCVPPVMDNFFIQNWFGKMKPKVSRYLGSAHMIICKEFFDSLGGFDGQLPSGEDYDLCERATKKGCEIIVNESLEVTHHDYPLTTCAFIKRESWHGQGDFVSVKAISKSKVAIAAMFFLALHISLLASAILGSFYLTACIVLIILAMLSLSSFIKFGNLKKSTRIKNISIFYFYYLGRSLSISELFKRSS